MTKRGRPRKDRPAIDLGTPELRAKRLMALGEQRKDPDGEAWPRPNLNDSGTALGRLLWRGFLHETFRLAKPMHDLGEAFATKWMIVYPKANPIGTLGRFIPTEGEGLSDEDRAAARSDLKSMTAYIGKERAVLDAVINCCVYQRLNPRQIEKLRTGLCRLVEWSKAQRRAA